eukprot:m.1544379 g.1544379  ORF g.1544379 m.1544379 type:complete len:52 (+) comp25258_c0_seq3:11846-12001(+)
MNDRAANDTLCVPLNGLARFAVYSHMRTFNTPSSTQICGRNTVRVDEDSQT